MSCPVDIKTASQWFALWKAVEEQIEDEYSTLIGVKDAENGKETLELDKRIEALQKLADRYKRKYEAACKAESGGSSCGRMKTYNNGL